MKNKIGKLPDIIMELTQQQYDKMIIELFMAGANIDLLSKYLGTNRIIENVIRKELKNDY